MTESRRTCRFGPYTVELFRRRLLRDGAMVPLSPTGFDLLVTFVEAPGEALSRESLIDRVWAGRHVEDGALSHYVSQLRHALGDNLEEYVATLPRRGYLFVSEVSWDEPVVAAAPVATPTLENGSSGRRRLTRITHLLAVLVVAMSLAGPDRGATVTIAPLLLAVLPFAEAGQTGGASGVGSGLADALVRELSRVPGLAVPAVGSSMRELAASERPVAAAQRLGARALVLGTVEVRGGGIAVSARLLDVPGGKTLWAGSFERPPTELTSLQDSLAQAITAELGVYWPSAHRPPTTSRVPAAQQAYSRGRHNQSQITAEGFARARRYYLEALALDPNFVQAQVELASLTYLDGYYGYGEGSPLERYRAAAAMVVAILRSHPDHPLALDLMGRLQDSDWRVPAAIESFERALQVAPFDPRALQHLAWALLTMGKVEEARSTMEIAALVDTAPLRSQTALAYFAHVTGAHREAVALFSEVLSIEPRFARAHLGLGSALTETGDYTAAAHHLELARELNGDPEEPLAAIGYLYAVCGKPGHARAVERELTQLGATPALRAQVAAGLGETERAVALLHDAVRERSLAAVDLVAPHFASLGEHPRFLSLRDVARGIAPQPRGVERIFEDE